MSFKRKEQGVTMTEQPTVTGPAERPAVPGERCSCGLPAAIVLISECHGEVPWCGNECI
jgi:hypothetical protein